MAPLEDDPEDEMLGDQIGNHHPAYDRDDVGGGPRAGGGRRRSESELVGEKMMLSLKETVKSVKQAMLGQFSS